MNGLVFPGNSLPHLRAELLSAAPNEAAAVLVAGQATTESGVRLFVREHHVVPADRYSIQEPYRVVLPPDFLMPLLKRARNEGWSLILSHTHPFSEEAQFSALDDAGEAVTMPALFRRTQGRSHGALVLQLRGLCGADILQP